MSPALIMLVLSLLLGVIMGGTAHPLMYGVWFQSVVQKHGHSEH